ncbi:MAG TPA: hypothetical protein VIK19_02645 [Syntrophales bacterium]
MAEKIQPDGKWMITNPILPEIGKGGTKPGSRNVPNAQPEAAR